MATNYNNLSNFTATQNVADELNGTVLAPAGVDSSANGANVLTPTFASGVGAQLSDTGRGLPDDRHRWDDHPRDRSHSDASPHPRRRRHSYLGRVDRFAAARRVVSRGHPDDSDHRHATRRFLLIPEE